MNTALFGKNDISEAARIIRNGGLIAVPTETVYGLCCSGLDETAVKEIYELKGRPEVKPLSLMVHDFAESEKYCVDIPRAAYSLAEKYLPGPLTIILKSGDNVPSIVRAGGSTVGIRCPRQELTLSLLEELGIPMAGPSANPSGLPSPKSAEDVLGYFNGLIPGVLDGGTCAVGVESTIIDMSKTPYRILRVGALTPDEVFGELRKALTIIGITGGTGTGKTTALDAVRELGGLVIDCDEVYHELLESSEEMLSEIRARFPDAFSGSGFDRKKLGRIVFNDSASLEDLNRITHKYVCAETESRLTEFAVNGGELASIDAIALMESGMSDICDAVVGVTAPTEARVERLIAREGISAEYAVSRIKAQPDNAYFKKNCAYVLENDGSFEEIQQKCRELIGKLAGR